MRGSAQAIVAGTQARRIKLSPAENFDSIPGHGVEARVDQRRVLIGNKKLMVREKVALDGVEERVGTLAADAKTAMYVDGQAVGVVAVADTNHPAWSLYLPCFNNNL
jgi:cation transport ATPase